MIDWDLLKIRDGRRSIWTVRVSAGDGPGDGIIDGLDAGVEVNEIPDGNTNGSHSNPSHHPLKGNHLVCLDPLPGILIVSDRKDGQGDQNH